MALSISPGHKELLIYLWTYGPHWRPGDPLPESGEVKAWPTKATCARDLGRSRETINTWVKGLARDGWIRRDGNVWELAVGAPFASDDARGQDQGGVNLDPLGVYLNPQGVCTDGGESGPPGGLPEPPGGESGRGRGVNLDPQILQGSSKDPPKILQQPQATEPAQSAHALTMAANPHLSASLQRHREISAKKRGPLFDRTPPRDLVAEVVGYFEEQSAALRQDLGLPSQKPAPMTTGVRHAIAMRLFGVEGDDDTKFSVARRVIDVQVAQCRARSEKHESDLGMLSLLWLFSDRNFDRVLDRWREDGNHAIWWARPEPSASESGGVRRPCGKCQACRLGYEESCNPFFASAGGEA